MKKMWILLVVVVVAAAIALGVTISNKNALQNDKDALTAQVAELTAQLKDAQTAAETAKSDAAAAKTEAEAAKTEAEAAKAELLLAKSTPAPTPTAEPTATPTVAPTATPTATPTTAPTATPTTAPTATPTATPTAKAAAEATAAPTAQLTAEATATTDPAAIALEEAKAAGKTIVTLWHSFTKGQLDMMNTITAEFNASNDKYYVNAQYQPSKGLESKTMNAVLAGEGPDLFFHYASEAANYVDADNPDNTMVVDLSKYINDPQIGIPNFADTMEASVYGEATSFADGGMYILPLVRTGPILYYNKTILNELGLQVPTTWEELAAASKTIKEKKGIYGYAADSLTDMMQALIMQKGSEYIDLTTKTAKINNQFTIDALKWYGENVKAGYFMAAPTSDYYSNDMNNQTVAMYIGSCAGIPYLFDKDNGWELGVAATPAWSDATTKWYPAWNRGFMMFKTNDAQQLGAYEFLKYFMAPEQNIRWCQSVICLSPFKATQALPEYQALIDANPALQALADCLPNAGFLPNIKGASTVRDELKSMAKMVGDESNTTSVEDMVAAAEKTCNDALQQ